ncbi:olfactory receptor 11A1-like [Rhinophrynus dorsalis]
MSVRNQTKVTEFLLLGFGNLHHLNFLFFIIFVVIFLFTLTGNLLIIILVSTSPHLHCPMYFFLCHLSVSDIFITTSIAPTLLLSILLHGETLSLLNCIIQLYFYSATTVTECLLLSVMSYDRYLAICYPLRYTSLMDFQICILLAIWPWLLGFTLSVITIVTISKFNFCYDNIIDHFYCDLPPIQKLSCSDTSFLDLLTYLFSVPIFIFPFCVIIGTYINIFLAILRIPSTTGKQKAFSTCSSHLIVVGAFYGTLIIKYMIPSEGYSSLLTKIISLLHTVITPLFNPIIYSLRNKDIRTALRKISTTRAGFINRQMRHLSRAPKFQGHLAKALSRPQAHPL